MSPRYVIRISKPVEKALRGLDQAIRARIFRHLGELAHSPFDFRFSKKLNGRDGWRRWRVGRKWRILYEVDSGAGIINILAVRPRSRVYEILKRHCGGFTHEYCPICQ
jgi:mRNA-degrading endonuclease RelE of RelBE toxin-antitoxin system